MIDLFIDIARQHLSYGDCLRLRWNIIRTAFCWIMWQCSQSLAHLHEQFLQVNQIEWHYGW